MKNRTARQTAFVVAVSALGVIAVLLVPVIFRSFFNSKTPSAAAGQRTGKTYGAGG